MDKGYIEMCKSATEIQEGWKINDLDRILFYGDDEQLIDVVPLFCKDRKFYKQTSIWLPRQEDLQELAVSLWDYVELGMLLRFNDYVEQKFSDGFKFPIKKIDQLWLCFVMEQVYDKRWNTETKKWDVI